MNLFYNLITKRRHDTGQSRAKSKYNSSSKRELVKSRLKGKVNGDASGRRWLPQ